MKYKSSNSEFKQKNNIPNEFLKYNQFIFLTVETNFKFSILFHIEKSTINQTAFSVDNKENEFF